MSRGKGERITPTGWRLVGSAAELVSPRATDDGPEELVTEDLLYAASFTVRPMGREPAVEVILSALSRAVEGVQPGLRPLARADAFTEGADRFHAVRWEVFDHEEGWAGELAWTHPHPVLGGVPCTTRVALSERQGRVEMGLHVGTPGGVGAVRGFVGAGQARPLFLAELARYTLLNFDGGAVGPHTLGEADIESFVRNVLLSDRRRDPVAVLAPEEPSTPLDAAEYLVPPGTVSDELLGLAHLYVLDRHPTTYRLSDALGDRRLSCYWGALRVYMPTFSCADSGSEHPLLVRDRVEDPVERAGLLGRLGQGARLRVPLASPVAELRQAAQPPEIPEAPAVPDGSAEPTRAVPFVSPDALTAPVVAALEVMGRELLQHLEELGRVQAALLDEVERLRTATVVRGANAAGVERRLAGLERLLRDLSAATVPAGAEAPAPGDAEPSTDGGDEEEGEDTGSTLMEVVQQAESEYSDALLILPTAVAAAQESPYRDVHRVAAHLKAMAELARRRQEGRLGMSLRDAFSEAGVDYRGGIPESTPKRLRAQYVATLPSGDTVECPEHIVLGTSYDPRNCLRIYFTSRAPAEPRFVITHIGRHFEVKTTT